MQARQEKKMGKVLKAQWHQHCAALCQLLSVLSHYASNPPALFCAYEMNKGLYVKMEKCCQSFLPIGLGRTESMNKWLKLPCQDCWLLVAVTQNSGQSSKMTSN